MKLFVVLCLVALTVAAPQSRGNYKYSPNDVQILRYNNDNIGVGPYKFGYEQSDGQRRDEEGILVNEGREDEYISVKGTYSWIGPNNIKYTVTYTADVNGYEPEIEEGPGYAPEVVATLIGAG